MNKARTTFTMPVGLLQRLKWFVETNDKTMSDVVQEGVEHVLDEAQTKHLDAMYKGLSKLNGKAKCQDPRLVNQNVDDILYGENSAWNGNLREELEK